jgi:hypothetical protein
MRHPQVLGVVHYLDDSLLDDYSFPMKKLHHKTISHLFSCVDDITGHKGNMCAAKKSPKKIDVRCTEIRLSCQHSKNIKRLKKNQFETQMNAQNNKRQNLSRKTAAS